MTCNENWEYYEKEPIPNIEEHLTISISFDSVFSIEPVFDIGKYDGYTDETDCYRELDRTSIEILIFHDGTQDDKYRKHHRKDNEVNGPLYLLDFSDIEYDEVIYELQHTM